MQAVLANSLDVNSSMYEKIPELLGNSVNKLNRLH